MNGPSPAFFSPGSLVAAPQLSILGFTGSVLQVLAGNPNNGDASGSQGNTSEATFAWTFTPSGSASGAVVNIPATATAFSLTATYKGGYATTKSGSVQQVDLVPNFSVSPSPVLKVDADHGPQPHAEGGRGGRRDRLLFDQYESADHQRPRELVLGDRRLGHGPRHGPVGRWQLLDDVDLQLHGPQRESAGRHGREAVLGHRLLTEPDGHGLREQLHSVHAARPVLLQVLR